MLQPFAVSLLIQKPNGKLEHALHIIEASSQDAAEARVMMPAVQSVMCWRACSADPVTWMTWRPHDPIHASETRPDRY